jgi:hypothetical protein
MPFVDHPPVTLANGTIQAGYREYLEPPPPPPAKTITDDELLKRRGWTAADLRLATSRLQFPAGLPSIDWAGKGSLTWKQDMIDRWESDLCGVLRQLKITSR